MHDILSDADKLRVRWGNQEILPYEVYAELEVSLDEDTPANEILVPFLITPERLHYPILGTNAIEHISQNFQSHELADGLNKCLPDKSKNVTESLVNFIHAEKPQELSNVKTPKHHVTIPAGQQVSVKCNIDRVVFEGKIPVDLNQSHLKMKISSQFHLYVYHGEAFKIISQFQFSTGVTMT